jgi:hypothetical protein
MILRVAFLIAITGVCAFSQRGSFGPPAGNINNPGIPVSGPSVSGPKLGAVIPPFSPSGSAVGLGFGGFGASLLLPPVPPAMPHRGGRYGYGYGGGYVMPGPIYGTGFDNFYRSVHNPEPGTYDPIFGVYGGGVYGGSGFAVTPGNIDTSLGQSPSVVINQYFQTDRVNPQVRDYSNVRLPQPGAADSSAAQSASPNQPSFQPLPSQNDAQIYFLIATKDAEIHAAAAYWVTGTTLNFVTLQGARSSVPLDQVDRDLSKRLNTGRSVEFELPPQ